MNRTSDPAADLLLSFVEFDIPRTPKSKDKTIKYEEIIGGNLKEEVVQMLKTGTQQRRLLVQGLTYAGTTPNPQNVIAAVNSYLPSVWRIQKSLETSKDTLIKLQKPLAFTWKSGLVPYGEDRSLTESVFIYEVAIILVVRALSHYNAAREEIYRAVQAIDNKESMNAMFKAGVTELRTGAGVLDYVAKYLQNWKKPPKMPIPEVDRRCLVGLQNYFLCQAQRILIARTILDKKYGIVPKLLLGLSVRFDTCLNYFRHATPMLQEVVEECMLMTTNVPALIFKYLAADIRNKIDSGTTADDMEIAFGKAVGFATRANAAFLTGPSPGVAKSKRLGRILVDERAVITEMYNETVDMNATIYFGPVDMDEAILPSRSEAKFLPQPIEYEAPPVEPLSFVQVPRAPPGVDQKVFEQMPVDIQNELWEQHRAELAASKDKMEESNQKGKKKKKKNKKKNKKNQPELPPGYDRSTFEELPKELQKEILDDYMKNRK
eukprot:CAMPEP_0184022272 /NCGR_PEP_ID=MMETSP0954-20121128/10505_1 /TAXON_ID=627963 /ORGANISM="Aplanochytrium sp, Strain PBS07" /LENGTH=490 /DNA_ID=CAMNT_0026304611 /DNA_START=140 /DNA_END=1612 /DNA_ORIENTATION=-